MKNLLSIVIPTKNRYKELEISLGFLSKLDDFNKVDLIIFDNSDREYKNLNESKNIFSRIKNLSNQFKIKILEQDKLSMTQNWEKALSFTIDKYDYTMLLEDKQILKKYSLIKIINLLIKF